MTIFSLFTTDRFIDGLLKVVHELSDGLKDNDPNSSVHLDDQDRALIFNSIAQFAGPWMRESHAAGLVEERAKCIKELEALYERNIVESSSEALRRAIEVLKKNGGG